MKWVKFSSEFRNESQSNGWPQNAWNLPKMPQKRVMFGLMLLCYGKYSQWEKPLTLERVATFHND